MKGQPIAEPGIPESFKVLIKELQSLGLDVKILTEDNKEVSIQELSNDELDTPSLGHEVEEELKDISLDFDNEDTTSDIISQEEVKQEFDVDNLFDEFDNFDE